MHNWVGGDNFKKATEDTKHLTVVFDLGTVYVLIHRTKCTLVYNFEIN